MSDLAVTSALQGAEVVGPTGERLGRVAEVLLDRANRQPTFVLVEVEERLRPLPTRGLRVGSGTVRTTASAATITAAPAFTPPLTGEQERQVLEHYGLDTSAERD